MTTISTKDANVFLSSVAFKEMGHYYDAGWYFWDEAGMVGGGPYASENIAIEKIKEYAAWLNEGQPALLSCDGFFYTPLASVLIGLEPDETPPQTTPGGVAVAPGYPMDVCVNFPEDGRTFAFSLDEKGRLKNADGFGYTLDQLKKRGATVRKSGTLSGPQGELIQ